MQLNTTAVQRGLNTCPVTSPESYWMITMMTRDDEGEFYEFYLFAKSVAKGSSQNPIVFFIRSTNPIFFHSPFLYHVIDDFLNLFIHTVETFTLDGTHTSHNSFD